ncbi:MAG: hypothetical protein JWN84_1148 [Nocardioides sp.]|nr:hypothetical protein [Nocardioides sp.]
MEPLPETRRALDDFGPFDDGDGNDLLEELRQAAQQVRDVVPSCVGLSLGLMTNGVTFTLVATSDEVAALDGVQYLDGGPCVASAHEGEPLTYEVGDPTDENGWTTFARAAAAHGISATLTLPILEDGRVIGSVNFYAAAPHAFDGHHERLAAIFDAWAPGAVTDADLGFETRRTAERAPEVLAEEMTVSQAVGLLMSLRGLDASGARALIEDAATRAGVSAAAVARDVIDIFGHHDSDDPR